MIDRRFFLSIASAALATPSFGAESKRAGRIITIPRLSAADTTEPRIRLWLPPSYDEDSHRHQTLYMLDGQYAFAADSEGINFSADERIATLMRNGTIRPTLVVAIDNLGEDRFLQYMPQSIYDRADDGTRAVVDQEIKRVGKTSLVSGQFIRFIERELKPYVDRTYRTSPERADTVIFGASMAGVMAGAIFVDGQQSFGRAGCMSPNWAIYNKDMIDFAGLPSIWAEYFSQLGGPAGRRLWLDHGTQMMDAGMGPHQTAIASALADLGWRRGCNLQTRVYEAGHAFAQTAAQMDEMLAWLLA